MRPNRSHTVRNPHLLPNFATLARERLPKRFMPDACPYFSRKKVQDFIRNVYCLDMFCGYNHMCNNLLYDMNYQCHSASGRKAKKSGRCCIWGQPPDRRINNCLWLKVGCIYAVTGLCRSGGPRRGSQVIVGVLSW